MKVEYDAIHDAGFLVQLDCPDLAAGRWANGGCRRAAEEWQKRMKR